MINFREKQKNKNALENLENALEIKNLLQKL